MIIAVDKTSLSEAATVHSISWKKSHCSFCSASFIEQHTPERQREYLERKMNIGSKIFMLVEEMPIGIVSVTDSLYYSQSKRYSNVSEYVIMETVMRNEAFSDNRS